MEKFIATFMSGSTEEGFGSKGFESLKLAESGLKNISNNGIIPLAIYDSSTGGAVKVYDDFPFYEEYSEYALAIYKPEQKDNTSDKDS